MAWITLMLDVLSVSNHLKVSFLKAQSARNKTVIPIDFVVESNSDIVFITETWFSTVADLVLIEEFLELTPPGFCIHSIPRLTGKGGGLCVIRSSITSSCSALRSYKSSEACKLQMSSTDHAATFILLYRPPPNKKNKLSTNMFVSEFNSYTSNRGQFIILGDFNLHFDSTSDQYVQTIKTTLEAECRNLIQIINTPTHRHNHILDWLIVRDDDHLVQNISVLDKAFSVHNVISFIIDTTKPKPRKKVITLRNLKSLNHEVFSSSVKNGLCGAEGNCNTLAELYNTVLHHHLDQQAPLRVHTIPCRQSAPRLSMEFKRLKQEQRRSERRWSKSRLTVH